MIEFSLKAYTSDNFLFLNQTNKWFEPGTLVEVCMAKTGRDNINGGVTPAMPESIQTIFIKDRESAVQVKLEAQVNSDYPVCIFTRTKKEGDKGRHDFKLNLFVCLKERQTVVLAHPLLSAPRFSEALLFSKTPDTILGSRCPNEEAPYEPNKNDWLQSYNVVNDGMEIEPRSRLKYKCYSHCPSEDLSGGYFCMICGEFLSDDWMEGYRTAEELYR